MCWRQSDQCVETLHKCRISKWRLTEQLAGWPGGQAALRAVSASVVWLPEASRKPREDLHIKYLTFLKGANGFYPQSPCYQF